MWRGESRVSHSLMMKVTRMLSARPQSLAITFWGMFELTMKESEGEKTHSPLALCVRSRHPPLSLFAFNCLRFSLVPCSPLNLGKACGGGRLIEISRNRGLTESEYISTHNSTSYECTFRNVIK